MLKRKRGIECEAFTDPVLDQQPIYVNGSQGLFYTKYVMLEESILVVLSRLPGTIKHPVKQNVVASIMVNLLFLAHCAKCKLVQMGLKKPHKWNRELGNIKKW